MTDTPGKPLQETANPQQGGTRRLLKTVAGSFGLKIAAAGLGFLSSAIIARWLGPAEFGRYAIIMAAVNLAAIVAAMGLPSLLTREIAGHQAHAQWGLLKGVIHSGHKWVLLASATVILVLLALAASGLVLYPLSTYLFLALLLVPLNALNQLRAGILRGLHKVVLADIPDLLLRPALILLLASGGYFFLTQASVAHAITIQLIAVGSALLLGSWLLHTNQPAAVQNSTTERHHGYRAKEALPFLGIALISTLEGQISLYQLGYLANSEQAGLFQAASQLVGLVVLGLMTINLALQPRLAAAWATGKHNEAQALVRSAARLGLLIAVMAAAILLPFAEQLLGIYGADYTGAANALRILVVAQLFNALAGSCGTVLTMTGHQNLAMQGVTLSLLVNTALGYWLIPLLGINGAALASLGGLLVWNTYMVAQAWRKTRLFTPVLGLLRKTDH